MSWPGLGGGTGAHIFSDHHKNKYKYPSCSSCRASWLSQFLALSSFPGSPASLSAFLLFPGVCGWPPGPKGFPSTCVSSPP